MSTMQLPRSRLGQSRLTVDRQGINFANTDSDLVHIAITVRNEGTAASEPGLAELWAAPLGAFVPWRPLALLQVPALEPGEETVLDWWAITPRPRTLGSPDRVSPRQLLTALGMEDDPSTTGKTKRRRGRSTTLAQAFPTVPLPDDPMALLGRQGIHWAGNLNVFVDNKQVERHMAQALRIYPGQTNIAFFILGTGQDAYAFELVGPDWDVKLYDMTGQTTLSLHSKRCRPLHLSDWIETDGMRMMLLAMQPPREYTPANLEVHVRQRSSGQTAVIEFSLDPNASGPGCFVV